MDWGHVTIEEIGIIGAAENSRLIAFITGNEALLCGVEFQGQIPQIIICAENQTAVEAVAGCERNRTAGEGDDIAAASSVIGDVNAESLLESRTLAGVFE